MDARTYTANLFKKYSEIYGASWSSRHKTKQEWENALRTWASALSNFSRETIAEAIKRSVYEHENFPPSLAQVVGLCISCSGIPSVDKVAELCGKRQFTHPLVHMCYQEIGSWDCCRLSSSALRSRIGDIYHKHLSDYMKNPQEHEIRVKDILSSTLEDGTIKLCDEKDVKEELVKEHPEWDLKKVDRNSREFDEKLYKMRRSYLVSLSERSALFLSNKDMYDRTRFKAENQAMADISGYSSENV